MLLQQPINPKKTDRCISEQSEEILRNPRSLYPRRESNPYGHYCPQDFKSCASTCSATRVSITECKKKSKHSVWILSMERKTGLEPATPTLARSCSTKWATSAWTKEPGPKRGRKNKPKPFSKKITAELLVLWVIQGAFLHRHVYPVVFLGIEHITAAKNEGHDAKYLQVKKKPGWRNPVMCEITVLHLL